MVSLRHLPGLALLGVLAAAAPLASALPGPAGPLQDPDQDRESLEELRRWVERYGRSHRPLDLDDFQELDGFVADLRMQQIAEPDLRHEIVLGLLDLAGARPPGPGSRNFDRLYQPDAQTRSVQKRGRKAVARCLAADGSGDLARWIATSVLSLPGVHPIARRVAAVEVLAGEHHQATRLAIFSCAVAPERALREAAMEALVGWQDDGVHRFMLSQLERSAEDPSWVSPRQVRLHFGSLILPADSAASETLSLVCTEAMLSRDWREALRALQLQSALKDEPAVPPLIEALAVWVGRRKTEGSSRRIEGEIVQELERRSGRSIGAHPERWATWWKLRSSGKERNPGSRRDPGQVTKSFFGLRPMTDKVVFVLDRSGSMSQNFGGTGKERHEEAVDQLMALLEGLGPDVRFRVILFDDKVSSWSNALKNATPANLTSVRTWLHNHGPRGGTNLRPAVEQAMRLDRKGRPDLRKLEADTVIVLCDGGTAEGAGWVRPTLASANEEACLKFHCVQVGGGGDGTLRLLASESGGDFVRVP